MREKMIVCLSVLSLLLLPVIAGAWSGGIGGLYEHHQKLVERAEQCIPLPRPPKKSCEKPVDKDLIKALKRGSAEPDWDVGKGGDGLNSPKHSYNPDYPAKKNWYDQAIMNKLGVSPEAINEGTAIPTIKDETNKAKAALQKIKEITT
ncbi:MAG: hypothetical protein HZA15_03595 [Nitrospirae bacterium]|nr:hypothetical protein [Nitrospirota bacterium]